MNRIIPKIKTGKLFTFDMPTVFSIKLSPRETDSIYCEHQYGQTYKYKYETSESIYFAVYLNGTYVDCKWKIEKATHNLYVKIHNSKGDKWELYIPGEYIIKLI